MMQPKWRLFFLSTPVGPLGSGLGGGLELTLLNLSQELIRREHQITIIAPAESSLADITVVGIEGQWQPTSHTQCRQTPIAMPKNGVLANMCEYAFQRQNKVDLIVNFAYDWLPFYLTTFFQHPLAHFVSMGSLSDVMDDAIEQVAKRFPGTLGAYTQTQAETFPNAKAFRCLGSAIDLDLYDFCAEPGPSLAWMGRISPEKGLEDALAAAEMAHVPLTILGKLEDHHYWQSLLQRFPWAADSYQGFLPTQSLQQVLRQCRALIMTPRWVEAFGNVAIEALACGVPIISYRRGGPTEIIQPGKTGWLVPPDNVKALADAITRVDRLDRYACRQQAEQEYSLTALGDRFEAWFTSIIQN
jgi:UDP-glucose:tetrahydrobiopterin glucosyltransferase